MMTKRLPLLLVFLIALMPIISFTVDDAYINFRYSENLVAGHGLVYNPGERVEGYTNFLWVILLAPFSLLPIPIEAIAKTLGILFSMLTLVYVWKLSNRIGSLKKFAYLNQIAPIAIILSITFDLYTSAGLETPLFSFFVVLSVYLVFCEEQRGNYFLSSIFLLLSALTRPEGVLIFCITCGYIVIRTFSIQKKSILLNKNLLLWISIFVLPGLIYFVLRYLYFRQLLPNTFSAKTGSGLKQLYDGFNYVKEYFLSTPVYTSFSVFMIFIFFLNIKKEKPFFIYVASIIGCYTVYICTVGGDWMKFYRFLHPIIPLWALLFQEGCKEFIKRFIVPLKNKTVRKLCFQTLLFLIFIALPVSSLYAYVQGVFTTKVEQAFWESAARRMGYWLRANGKPHSTIAMGDIGEIGYRTNFKVIDMLGLVTPYISHLEGGYTTKDPKQIAEYVMDRMPEYILFVTNEPTRNNMPRPHHECSEQIVKTPEFSEKYRTFFQLRVSNPFCYWIIMAQKDKTAEYGLGDGISHNFENGLASGWKSNTLVFDQSAPLSPTGVSELENIYNVWGFEGEYALNVNSAMEITSEPFLITKRYLTFISASNVASEDNVIELIIDQKVIKKEHPPISKSSEITKWDLNDWINAHAYIKLSSSAKTQDDYFIVDYFKQTNN
ncbi:MAG: hypothetical protein M0036_04575 [Desulfobacteraceae bacterium]|nr:hypothetical protein [Desulfobacteraceae bacterium]